MAENSIYINNWRSVLSGGDQEGSHNKNFANVCLKCLGGRCRRVRRQTYNRDCRLCGESFTVVDWRKPYSFVDSERSSTAICYNCSKLHVVCQRCGLQPQRGVRERSILHLRVAIHQSKIDKAVQWARENGCSPYQSPYLRRP